MVIDTSALISILENEKDASNFARKMSESSALCLSAGTYLEAAIVMVHRRGIGGLQKLDELLETFSVQIEQFDRTQAERAIRAYQQYGRGQHLAKLNFGDLFSYSLAKKVGEPLLYKGKDFSKTDLA